MSSTLDTTHRHCRSGCDRPPTTRVVMRSASGRIWVSYHCDDVTHAVPPHELEAMGLTPLDDIVAEAALAGRNWADVIDDVIRRLFGLPDATEVES